jgi:hypothetical protein
MRAERKLARLIALAALAAPLLTLGSASAEANWLARLGRGAAEIGEAGGQAGKLGLGALETAAGYVSKLPATAKGVPLAAHATAEGHWKFVNREGEVFTAGSPEELKRALPTLAPEAAQGQTKLTLYLSEDTVFDERALLKDLPQDADLHVVVGDDSYRLIGRAEAGNGKLLAEVRPNIVVELNDRKLFEEALFHLARPLNASSIRVLALEPGGPKTLASVPSFDPATKAALVDRIDPGALPAALAKARGQTVLITGRVEGDRLYFRPASGAEEAIFIKEVTGLAEAADVNLVILEQAAARQPGGRNWLWQKVEVQGLGEALQRATFADFLNALGASRGQLTVTAAPERLGRVTLRAVPTGATASPLSDALGEWFAEVTSNITGNVLVSAVNAHMSDADRQRELDARFIPGVPSWLQIAYLVGLTMGVLGLPVARAWWPRIWPPERREEYAAGTGYQAARSARLAAFVFLFLPVAGAPAFLWITVLQFWSVLASPFRFLGWLRARLSLKTS